MPCLARSSASSLPGVPAWALTQCKVTLRDWQRRVRVSLQFRTVLEEQQGLPRALIAGCESINRCASSLVSEVSRVSAVFWMPMTSPWNIHMA